MKQKYFLLLFLKISLIYFFSCSTVADKSHAPVFLDLSEINADGFSLIIDTDKIIPGNSYKLNVIFHDNQLNTITGQISPEYLYIQSDNNSFEIDNNTVTASEDIFRYLQEGYRLTVTVKNTGFMSVTENFEIK